MSGVYLKWAGGKRRLSEIIRGLLGPCRGAYIEPFVGSGAVFFDRVEHDEIKTALLADTNRALIACHRQVRDRVDDVLTELATFDVSESWKEHYYTERNRLNSDLEAFSSTPVMAARFIWINRTCFNGLWRVNRKGKFNVPSGRYVRPSLPSEATLRAASVALACAELRTLPFERTFAKALAGDQIYADPPYWPRSKTSSFVAYDKGGFGPDAQAILAQAAREASDRGIRVVCSNHDLPEVHDLYRDFETTSVQGKRSISAKGTKRMAVGEILAVR